LAEEIGEPFVSPPSVSLSPTAAIQPATRVIPLLVVGIWLMGAFCVVGYWILQSRRVWSALRFSNRLDSGREWQVLRRIQLQRRTPVSIQLFSAPSLIE